jgi:hypothetical protein
MLALVGPSVLSGSSSAFPVPGHCTTLAVRKPLLVTFCGDDEALAKVKGFKALNVPFREAVQCRGLSSAFDTIDLSGRVVGVLTDPDIVQDVQRATVEYLLGEGARVVQLQMPCTNNLSETNFVCFYNSTGKWAVFAIQQVFHWRRSVNMRNPAPLVELKVGSRSDYGRKVRPFKEADNWPVIRLPESPAILLPARSEVHDWWS